MLISKDLFIDLLVQSFKNAMKISSEDISKSFLLVSCLNIKKK